MKVIDLLNKIANGEEVPKKIVHHSLTGDMTWEFEDNCQVEYGYKMTCFCDKVSLNDEVEILEEEKKIPEKIEYEVEFEKGELIINGFTFDCEQKIQIIDTVNEIIDYLKSKGE